MPIEPHTRAMDTKAEQPRLRFCGGGHVQVTQATIDRNRRWAKAVNDERARRQSARRATRRAIVKGLLVRRPCEVCRHPTSEAHHDDYDKPLEVRWLCAKHHHEHHQTHDYSIAGEAQRRLTA